MTFRIYDLCTDYFIVLTRKIGNKKLLLRERKRHTARRIASARYAALCNGGGGTPGRGGTPSQVWVRGYPISGPGGISHLRGVPHLRSGGVPHHRSGEGTPSQVGRGVLHLRSGGTLGTPHHPDLVGGHPGTPYPDLRWGTPYLDLGWGTPYPDLRWILPPPPRKCEQTENITFPHPSDAGGNKFDKV